MRSRSSSLIHVLDMMRRNEGPSEMLMLIWFSFDYLVVWEELAIFANGTYVGARLSGELTIDSRIVVMTQVERW